MCAGSGRVLARNQMGTENSTSVLMAACPPPLAAGALTEETQSSPLDSTNWGCTDFTPPLGFSAPLHRAP